MDAIRQTLTLIGADTVLGGVLWALGAWTTWLGPAWIIVGVVIAVGGAAA